MSDWQVVLEFVKTLGASSLLGVIIGLGATRLQKKKEALYAIHAANYREVINGYRELAKQLLAITDAARRAIVSAQMKINMLTHEGNGADKRLIEHLASALDEKIDKYDSSTEGLEDKVSNLIVHRSETNFHSHANWVLEQTIYLSTNLQYVQMLGKKREDLDPLRESFKRFEDSVGLLALIWDGWKIEAERYAAGLRPVPLFRRHRPFTERRL